MRAKKQPGHPLSRPTMSVQEAADLLGVSRETAYDAVHSGDIPSFRIMGKIVIPSPKVAEKLGLPYPYTGE